MRTLATAVVSVVMALGALGLALAAPHRGNVQAPKAAIGDASGALLISNSRAGQAVFSAPPMRPGETVGGTVRIGNAGHAAGRFSVRLTGVHDTPGAYGGRLSEQLQLALVDVTATPVAVFAGTAAGLADVDLGTLAAGGQRDYRLTATLPDGGLPAGDTLGDNRFQGAALSLDLEWRAVASDDGSGGGANDGGGSAGGGSTGSTGGSAGAPTTPPGGEVSEGDVLADTLGLPPATTCVNRRRMTIRLRVPGGARIVSATVKVNRKVKRRVNGSRKVLRVKLRRLPAKRFRIVVNVRASDGRSYTTKRVYRACNAKKPKLKLKLKRKRR